MRLSELISAGRFAAPATREEIERAEQLLTIGLPQQLRSLYQQCDGFREPLGNAKYLLALLEDDSIGSLVSWTRFWWLDGSGADRRFDARSFVFFGFSSADESWGIRWKEPFDLIACHYGMEDGHEPRGSDILALYADDLAAYGSADL